MRTYIYYEACGYASEPFTADDDAAAEAHVAVHFPRDARDPDFDGDAGGIVRLDEPEWDGDNGRRLVIHFPGEHMIDDPLDERQAYRGGVA